MNIAALEHQSDTRYCYSLGGTKARIVLRTARNDDFSKIELVWWDSWAAMLKGGFVNVLVKVRHDALFDYYETDIDNGNPAYSYVFRLFDNAGRTYFYSESGLTDTYDFRSSFMDEFVFSFPNSADAHPENSEFEGRVFYQIFPERFACANPRKSFINQAWGTDKPDNLKYCGGDFQGIIAKLDYLKSLGVDALYFNPIYPSSTAHGYDVEDYFGLNPHFGSSDDFHELVAKAHERDIKIVLDLVFNHSSNRNSLFQDVLKNGTKSPYWSWYFVFGDKPTTSKPLNYLTFADVLTMPKLNTSNPEVQDYLGRVGEFWLRDFDIDGYRLDVSFEIAHVFWRHFRERCLKVKPSCILIGEDWLNSESRLGEEWDSTMNYPFRLALLRFREEKRDASWLSDRLNGLYMRYKEPFSRMMLNLLSSHDVPRWITLCQGDRDFYLQSYAIMFFYPGWPCVYYGDEIFMTGGQDPLNRIAMKWESLEFGGSDFADFKSLLLLRKKEPLRKGDFLMGAEDSVLWISRSLPRQKLILYANLGKKDVPLPKGHLVFARKADGKTLQGGGIAVVTEEKGSL